MFFFKHIVLCARITNSKSSIFNPPYSNVMNQSKPFYLILSFPNEIKKFFVGYVYEIIRNVNKGSCRHKFGMANDLTICIFPIGVSLLHFHIVNVLVWGPLSTLKKHKNNNLRSSIVLQNGAIPLVAMRSKEL